MTRLRSTILACLLLGALLSWGCSVEPEPNKNSGSDGEKAGAREVPIGRLVTGSVDRESGDATDWFYFRITATGVIDLTASFDQTEAVGVILVRDSLGTQIARLEHRALPVLRATFRGEPGIYYAEVFVENGRSEYTLQVDFEALF